MPSEPLTLTLTLPEPARALFAAHVALSGRTPDALARAAVLAWLTSEAATSAYDDAVTQTGNAA